MDLELEVECYSGHRADERPLRFAFAGKPGTPKYEVKAVLDQWYGVGYQCFKVLVDDGNITSCVIRRAKIAGVSIRFGAPEKNSDGRTVTSDE